MYFIAQISVKIKYCLCVWLFSSLFYCVTNTLLKENIKSIPLTSVCMAAH